MLHSMILILTYVHQLEPLYLCYGVKCHPGVIWGHGGQKAIFTKKKNNSSNLYSMTIRLKDVYQLQTLYLCYGLKCQ